jgi:hypothetical protein
MIATMFGKCVDTQDEVLGDDGSSKLDGFGELDGITQVVVCWRCWNLGDAL